MIELMKKIWKPRLISIVLLTGLISFQTVAQALLPAGYPDRSSSLDVLPGFIQPPKGYGEVPFYWWQGDTLTRERLEWQLNQLQNKGISSLQINYSHLDQGGISYGLSNPSKPALFTDAWWDLFKWFSAEAQKRGMTVSLSDYTLGIGQGFSMDEAIRENPELNGSVLRKWDQTLTGKVNQILPENLLSLTAFRMNADSSLIPESRKNLLPEIANGYLKYDFGSEKWKLVGVHPERLVPSYDPMNPNSGKAYNKHFFGKFEQALGKNSGKLDFFFSDELNFRVGGNLWNSTFAAEFKKRKGYDVIPFLDALFYPIGSMTPKIRLDFNDVLVSLSEENFFKPVFDWHEERGMIFGCDHGGRGREVAEFGDYFRTQRWNQGPGSDQPNLGKDIIKAKVASSISHLYQRPRVWLEGFYGSGWGTSSSDVTDAIFANFVAGYNLLSFHGLYYSTEGGWWEWAPPDNHFRMPYWQQIDPLMNCIQRLSYLMSQGVHQCDVAILYPVEPVVAGMDGNRSVNTAFEAGEKLYDQGIDFDFIDFESLGRSKVNDKEIQVSGEKYKVLIIPSMKAIRFASLQKIQEFLNGGGIVVNIGERPEATEKNGSNDPELLQLTNDIFTTRPNLIQVADVKSIVAGLSGKYDPNFKILSDIKQRPYVMHRRIGNRQVFALYNLPAGSQCFFRAKGSVELWNPWTGQTTSLERFAKPTPEGTELNLPLSEKEIQMVIFNSEPSASKEILEPTKPIRQIPLGNEWEFELKPSLDNQWGDFQLPASNEMMGAQVRQLHFTENKDYHGEKLSLDDIWQTVTCAYGKQFLKLGALPVLPSEEEILKMTPEKPGNEVRISGKPYRWEAYGFSWQSGVEGDYGHQGYHGLKGNLYDNFIRLGALAEEKHSKLRKPEAAGNFYLLYSNVIAPADGDFELLSGTEKPALLFVNGKKTEDSASAIRLKKGANPILAVYNKACETYLVFRRKDAPRAQKKQLCMSWYHDFGLLQFDYSGQQNSSGIFAFESAPGLQMLNFSAYGKVAVWADGIQQEILAGSKQTDGLTNYTIHLKTPNPGTAHVVLKIDYQPGYSGAAALPDYIRQSCGKGTISLGDWSEIDGLKAYSGGAWYRKTISLKPEDMTNKLELDLGNLVSSAEVLINGKSAGIKLAPPWKFDITKLVNAGENKLEVLIYNTLANNYTTVPTRYRGSIRSGLIGPLNLNVNQ
jgi:hypothetical protein